MTEYIKFHDEFASIEGDDTSRVFELFPKVFKDGRGSFSEVMKEQVENDQLPQWLRTSSWIKQINRSTSSEGTIRGCHAQKGAFCQGKLVEAVNCMLFDIIIDARPDSKSYSHWGVFVLDPERQNKLWVPRGFLHSFVTPMNGKSENFIFQYYCDNVYSHESEFGISPLSIIPKIVDELKANSNDNAYMKSLFDTFDHASEPNLSEKDLKGFDCQAWLNDMFVEYNLTGKLWYK